MIPVDISLSPSINQRESSYDVVEYIYIDIYIKSLYNELI